MYQDKYREIYSKLFITALSMIASYYIAILLHQTGHSTAAWFLGYKESSFDFDPGGWALLDKNEEVPYEMILASSRRTDAAFIGIAGLSVSTLLFTVSIVMLNQIKQNIPLYSFFFWFAVANLVPMIKDFSIQTFSSNSDMGRFTTGLGISPWWVFIPSLLSIIVILHYFFKHEIPKAYVVIGIQPLIAKRIFLAITLYILFLMIYVQEYNPFFDDATPLIGKILELVSFLLVPILYAICNPSREWVKREIQRKEFQRV